MYCHADAICGHSQEILDHIKAIGGEKKPCFLYRNLQRGLSGPSSTEKAPRTEGFQIVYAGLLGIAQDILSIVQHIDFAALGKFPPPEKAIAAIVMIRFTPMPESLRWICSIKTGITLNTNKVVEDG